MDLLYTTRAARYVVQNQIKKMEALEGAIEQYFIEKLDKDSSGLSGKVARVQIETKTIPVVEDWPALYKHIKKTGEFELLQRRLGEGAIKERWEAKKRVPGVGRFNAKKVSCTKLK